MAFQHGPPSPHGRRDSSRRGNGRSSLTEDSSSGYGRSRDLKNGYGPKTGGYFSDDSGLDDGERHRDSLSHGRSGYEVDHLVTWSVGPKGGVLTPEDGVRELRIMEQQTGIWTMRCILEITPTYINIVDGQTGEEREKFPLELVEMPAAFSSDPRVDAYNNLLLFTIPEDPKKKYAPSEMHIFQVLRQSARDLVDEINEIKFRGSTGKSIAKPSPPPSSGSRHSIGEGRSSVPDIRNQEAGMLPGRRDSQPKPVRRVPEIPVESGTIENYVTLLNRCFDEIEKFVARLQMSADAFKELDRRMKMRAKSKNRHGDGMLTMRARAPPPHDFMDIFQKFKLCFNLLALLKNHIHDPNAPELVHFLFTPLSLIVEASKDPRHGHPDIAVKAISPILSREAKELLQHCLTSKEADLWIALGDAWIISRDQWGQGYVPPYHPKFDGWEPPHSWLEEVMGNPVASAVASVASRRISELDRVLEEADNAPPRVDYRLSASGIDLGEQRNSAPALVMPPLPVTAAPLRTYIPPAPPAAVPLPHQQQVAAEINGLGGLRRLAWEDAQKQYLRDLQNRNARIYEAAHDRQGNNAKELNTTRGEIVEVLDDSRNWWKCRNHEGNVGHIPYTILKKYGSRDDGQLPDNIPSPGQLSDGGGAARVERQPSIDARPSVLQPPPPPPPPPPAVAPPVIIPKAAAPKPAPPKPAKKDSIGDATAMAASIAAEIRRRVQLYSKTNQAPPKSLSRPSPAVFIDQYSTAEDVAKWLDAKGFQQETKLTFESCTGRVLFELTHDEILRYLGRDEGARLESQLKLMKVEANYTVNSSSELKAILNRQRERANSGGSDENANSTTAVAVAAGQGRPGDAAPTASVKKP